MDPLTLPPPSDWTDYSRWQPILRLVASRGVTVSGVAVGDVCGDSPGGVVPAVKSRGLGDERVRPYPYPL